MIINKNKIQALSPCSDRFNNYVDHYGDKEFTIAKFMELKNITHADKLWVAFRLLPKAAAIAAAADMAELVLPIYEAKYPGDMRPRKAIEAARSGDRAKAEAAAKEAYAAAYAADASSAAHAASSAAYAAADAAAWAASAAGKDIAAMEKRQRTILIKYLKGVK